MSGRTVFLDGRRVTLAELPLKGGGQAAVFPVEGDTRIVVKIYRDTPGPDQERRLARMLTMSPLAARPTDASQPPELAWPTTEPRLELSAAQWTELASGHGGKALWVRQLGTHAASDPVLLTIVA